MYTESVYYVRMHRVVTLMISYEGFGDQDDS